jgi:hypothetical protein
LIKRFNHNLKFAMSIARSITMTDILVSCADGQFRATRNVLTTSLYFAAAVDFAEKSLSAAKPSAANPSAAEPSAAEPSAALTIKFDDTVGTMSMIYRYLLYGYAPETPEFTIVVNYYNLATNAEACVVESDYKQPTVYAEDSPHKKHFECTEYIRHRKFNIPTRTKYGTPIIYSKYFDDSDLSKYIYDTYAIYANVALPIHIPANLVDITFSGITVKCNGVGLYCNFNKRDIRICVAQPTAELMAPGSILEISDAYDLNESWMIIKYKQ